MSALRDFERIDGLKRGRRWRRLAIAGVPKLDHDEPATDIVKIKPCPIHPFIYYDHERSPRCPICAVQRATGGY